MTKKLGLVLVLVLVASGAGAGELIKSKMGQPIKDQYIVQFTPGAAMGAQALAQQLAGTHGGQILYVYDALNGAAFKMNESQARAMANNPNVQIVEEDVMFHVDASGNQSNPPAWGIDRIDERTLPDDNNYHWDFSGEGVTAFILDTGMLVSHSNFTGRASWGTDCTGEGQNDGHGHGTHVAGTVGSETYGVAKDVNLVAVKVCNSGGSCPSSATSCGINYVINQKNANLNTPMVANMSIGGPFSQTSNNNVASGVASGVFFAVAASNDNSNACNFSPASEPTAYTVGSTTASDSRSSFSNFGTCVDIFAPGSSILSTWNNGGTNTISGTSMASPHVAGAGALVLEQHPTWTPAQVDAELDARATQGELSGIGSGSPNALLYTIDDGAPPPPPPPPPPTCSNALHTADFESGSDGWVDGASTCSTGDFVQGTPDGVNNGGVQTQVSGAASGSGAWFTQPNTGGAGTDDVDGGTCETLSPSVNASGTVTVSLDYFHGQRDANDDSGDFFSIEVLVNGSVAATMASFGDVTSNAAWTSASTSVNAGSGSSVQLRVRAADAAGPGDLVEGGVDNVEICGDGGTPPPPPPPGGCEDTSDDFEGGAAGWSNSGSSTCSTGDYVLGNPTQVTNGGVTTQVGGSNSGVNSIFTATNSSAGVDDVDGGNCILDSPVFAVGGSATLSVAYWHGQRDAGDDASGDFFILEYSTNGGSSWNTLASNGDSTSNAAWATASAQINADNVQLRVQCSDGAGPGDLVECGIDDVSITCN